jgi:ribose/xylose/arabinose/galactoside ABC-type transport system permease subunit
MSMRAHTPAAGPGAHSAPVSRRFRFRTRFTAIWIAMLGLIVFCAIVAPRSLLPSTFLAIIPLAAFLAIAAIGETLVLMARGIDLSIPAVTRRSWSRSAARSCLPR